jgi:hypothetical protein
MKVAFTTFILEPVTEGIIDVYSTLNRSFVRDGTGLINVRTSLLILFSGRGGSP